MTDTKRFLLWLGLVAWGIFSLTLLEVQAQQCSEDQYAANTVVVKKKGGSVSVSAGTGCMSGTYVAAGDFDYSVGGADTDKMCIGSTPIDGTVSGAAIGTDYGETGNGVLADAADEYVTWPLADVDFDEAGAYTVCIRFRVGSDGVDTNTSIFEIAEDTGNTNQFYITISDDERFKCNWEGNDTSDNVTTNAAAITRDGSTWYTGVCSWKVETAVGADFALSINGGASWVDEDDDDPVAMAIQVNYVSVGNRYGPQAAGADPVHIDKWAIISGYKQACPW